ncbi:MAG TPA: hypothetical protein VJR05_04410 [Acidimicrobiia bacterium]|nr:hypothetical protein [Acidimicrobiia bacterium]
MRTAVKFWLTAVEQRKIDVALATGYDIFPAGRAEEHWAEVSIEALDSSQLDW